MRNAVRVAIALVGVFSLALGLGFLVDPAGAGARFFLVPNGIQGLATMRADFTAFFGTSAVFALIAAWHGRGGLLVVPLVSFGIALAARVVSLALDGASPTVFPPMIVEAVMIAVLLIGRRVLKNPT